MVHVQNSQGGSSHCQHPGLVQLAFPWGQDCMARLYMTRRRDQARVGVKLVRKLRLVTNKMIMKIQQDGVWRYRLIIKTQRQKMTSLQDEESAGLACLCPLLLAGVPRNWSLSTISTIPTSPCIRWTLLSARSYTLRVNCFFQSSLANSLQSLSLTLARVQQIKMQASPAHWVEDQPSYHSYRCSKKCTCWSQSHCFSIHHLR